MEKKNLRGAFLLLCAGVVFSLSFATSSVAAHRNGETICFPKTKIRIYPRAENANGITEEKFNSILDVVEKVYQPIFSAQGKNLIIHRLWEDPTLNASAIPDGNDSLIYMYGGLARHKAITTDGFALIACHEIGHHLGGAPKYPGDEEGEMSWASNEGQSDYFATSKCLRRVFRTFSKKKLVERTRNAIEKKKVPRVVLQQCQKRWSDEAEQALCIRSSMAGRSVARLFQALKSEERVPKFATYDKAAVEKTFDSHPETQCRLDTYFRGSLCPVSYKEPVSDLYPEEGYCSRVSGFPEITTRPKCWFKPVAE